MVKKFLFFFVILILFSSPSYAQTGKKTAPNKPAPHYKVKSIADSYFLQITLDEDNCEKIVGVECEFKDRFIAGPYFHPTKLTLYLNKIIATQSFESGDSKLLKVRDGAYKLVTDNGNLVSFAVTKGDLFDLKTLQGNLENEVQKISKCDKGKMLYDFYTTYKRQDELYIKNITYSDEYDFDEVRNLILLSEKKNQSDIMALSQSTSANTAIANIRLCKFPKYEKSVVKHVTADECQLSTHEQDEECFRYQECIDHAAVKNCEVTLFTEGFED